FAPIHADTRTGTLIYTNSYYYIGHFSKFIRPGARRIVASPSRSMLLTTGFVNDDGTVIVVVMNPTAQGGPYNLTVGGASLELDGLDPTTHQTEVRKRFGVVFQDPSLDGELTAWENMDIHGVLYHVPRNARRERCEALLRMFELWERRNDLVKTFSGGMKR